VFDVPKKRGLVAPRGVAALAAAVERAAPTPVLALGGATAANAAQLRAAGVAGVACIREILASDDAKSAARRLLDAWRSGR
jgi:thiamine-phosphate pyrophosphorylase